ncbi:HesA/MoeB/ThiF family protein [Lunatibacter salilacus]|uniref:HesA/MoeB/ThiF family protein n=1 Tax=Lunatibacter salilacus TaxID=2483804 RepID=UPI00131D8C3D|nr:HesA/MoeB/ThiF family protein [Lunatibacter salilacus]
MQTENRYIRQIQLPNFGREGQVKLRLAKVLVVGAGGLGVPVLQYLAGMGIGTLGIVDGDTVAVSNLHRQVIYDMEDVGTLKVAACRKKLSRQNPEIILQTYPFFLTTENALEVMSDYDVIVDATDNFAARYLINDACIILGKPFVYGALQYFEGQVSVFNYQGGPTYRCLFPTPPDAGQIPDCNQAGVLGIVPGIIGSYQALETVKIVAGLGKVLSGELLILDLLGHHNYRMKLKTNPENQLITRLADDYDSPICETIASISPEELLTWYETRQDFLLIDVRESHEFAQGHLENAQSIPLSKLERIPMVDLRKQPVVIMCQMGSRSEKAIQLIQNKLPDATLLNLTGGINQWYQEIGEAYIQ